MFRPSSKQVARTQRRAAGCSGSLSEADKSCHAHNIHAQKFYKFLAEIKNREFKLMPTEPRFYNNPQTLIMAKSNIRCRNFKAHFTELFFFDAVIFTIIINVVRLVC